MTVPRSRWNPQLADTWHVISLTPPLQRHECHAGRRPDLSAIRADVPCAPQLLGLDVQHAIRLGCRSQQSSAAPSQVLVHALEMAQVQKWAPAELAAVLCEYASFGRGPAAHLAINVRRPARAAGMPWSFSHVGSRAALVAASTQLHDPTPRTGPGPFVSLSVCRNCTRSCNRRAVRSVGHTPDLLGEAPLRLSGDSASDGPD